jgi:hypothetical protein
MRGVGCGVSANEDSCAHGAPINFGDLTPYLTFCAKKCEKFQGTGNLPGKKMEGKRNRQIFLNDAWINSKVSIQPAYKTLKISLMSKLCHSRTMNIASPF